MSEKSIIEGKEIDLDSSDGMTIEELFASEVINLLKLRMVGFSFQDLANIFSRPRRYVSATEVEYYFTKALCDKAFSLPDGCVEEWRQGTSIIFFSDPDYPEGIVRAWPNGRRWLLVRTKPPRELPRWPRSVIKKKLEFKKPG